MKTIAWFRFATLALGLSALLGCASVSVQPASRRSDERAGMPFYLQRPYVVVEREMPTEGCEGYLSAVYEPRGKSFTLQGPLPCVLGEILGEHPAAVPQESVAVLNESVVLGQTFGGDEDKAGKGGAAGAPEEPDKKDAGRKNSTSDVATGSGTLKWDSSVPQTLRDGKSISVVFLPDLDEKYVVSVDGGLGTASTKVALGPGGTANQFEANVDNREIGRFLFDEVGKFTDLAIDLIKVKNKLKKQVTDDAGQTFGGEEWKGPRSVALRYIYVGFAVPGMYPILKDSEYGPVAARRACTLGMTTFSAQDPFLREAQWPFTRYAVRLRREFVMYIEDFHSKPRDTTVVEPAAGGSAALDEFLDAIPAEMPLPEFEVAHPPAERSNKVSLTVRFDRAASRADSTATAPHLVFTPKEFSPTGEFGAYYKPDLAKPDIDAAILKKLKAQPAMVGLSEDGKKVLDALLAKSIVVRKPQPLPPALPSPHPGGG